MTPTNASGARIREVTFDDFEAVRAVARRNGLGGDSPHADPAAALRAFESRWTAFPDRDRFAGVPIGWALEDAGGRCVGTLTNYWGTYRFRGATYTAAIAGGLAVDPEFRGPLALMLVARHVRQPGIDLSITTTASPRAGAILASMKCLPIPHPALDEARFWITNHGAFARAAVRQRKLPAEPLAGLLAMLLRLRDAAALPRTLTRESARIERCTAFDSRFDRFWDELCRRNPERLLAVRTSAMLAWHFQPYFEAERIAIFVARSGEGLAGYAIVTFDDDPLGATARAHLVDLQVAEPDPGLVRELSGAAYRAARERNLPMLQVIGFDAFKRDTMRSLGPLERKLPNWLYYYKALRPELAGPLASPATWDPCPYDGDATL